MIFTISFNRTVISFLNCSRTLWSHSDSFQSEVESLRLRWQAVLNKLTTQREKYVYFFVLNLSHNFIQVVKCWKEGVIFTHLALAQIVYNYFV